MIEIPTIQEMIIDNDKLFSAFCNLMSEDELINIIYHRPGFIRYVSNPSELVCLTAVSQNYGSLQFINNPCQNVFNAALLKSGQAIQYIDNPSAIQLKIAKMKMISDHTFSFYIEGRFRHWEKLLF